MINVNRDKLPSKRFIVLSETELFPLGVIEFGGILIRIPNEQLLNADDCAATHDGE